MKQREAAKFIFKSKIRNETQMYTMSMPFRALCPVGFFMFLAALHSDYRRSVIFWMVK